MAAKQVLVLGGGFAGLWSAVGAARKLDELGIGPDEVAVTLVNRDPYHCIRVRSYESDISDIRVPLDDVLEPVGVRREEAAVVDLDPQRRTVVVHDAAGAKSLSYDRLVFALGSQVFRPDIPGLNDYSFDVDNYDGAARLKEHLPSLRSMPASPRRNTILVVGAGLVGVEAATEIAGELQALLPDGEGRVLLVDHADHIGSDMGPSAQPVIAEALASLGVETRVGVRVAKVDPAGAVLDDGERIDSATVIWCAGMRANPLTRRLGVPLDRFGRVAVDEFMRVNGVPGVFAAGDAANAMMDSEHTSVMSCQHGRPMGRFAGHNVICDLVGLPLLPLEIDWYVTVLDLGTWGAVYTNGWDRRVVAQGAAAKETKQVINRQRIYPPRTRNRREILDAAAPVVQRPPAYRP